MDMEKGTMNVRQLQVYMGIGRKKSYELVNSRNFPAFRIGRKILVSREGLEKWMLKQQEEGKGED